MKTGQEYMEYVTELVRGMPGHYTKEDLILELRRYEMSSGNGDPGLLNARNVVESAVRRGEILVAEKRIAHINLGFVCYPKDHIE